MDPLRGRQSHRAGLVCTVLVSGLLCAALFAPADAAALSGTQLITFEGFSEHTEISTQYEGQGIVFAEQDGFYPEIRWDAASISNPVLGGTFGFGSSVGAKFVVPGTTTPATVENLAMDVGEIDDPGSTRLTIERTSGPSYLYADEFGFDHLLFVANDITGFTVESVDEDINGWEIDNLGYTIPPPPPPLPLPTPPAPVVTLPPSCPKYLIVDSRGSGEKKGILSPRGKNSTSPSKVLWACTGSTR